MELQYPSSLAPERVGKILKTNPKALAIVERLHSRGLTLNTWQVMELIGEGSHAIGKSTVALAITAEWMMTFHRNSEFTAALVVNYIKHFDSDFIVGAWCGVNTLVDFITEYYPNDIEYLPSGNFLRK